jgi:hypothetical protein
MRRAIAGIGVVVIASMFVLLVPVVPAAAHTSTASQGVQCAIGASTGITMSGCVQGYGSISFRLFGVGGTWFSGGYQFATNSNFTVQVTA